MREGHSAIYPVRPGDTYADALLFFGIVPDTVLIFQAGKSLPEDEPIEADEVDIVTTSSRG
ncbi:MAG: thiamine S protein [Methanomicrobiaceae archaeon]|nr:thiamine S protein [Methanomicrobiaceae archaeon]